MRLKECEGKEIFKQYNIAVPKGVLLKNKFDGADIALKSDGKLMIKPQTLSGKRGIKGLIRIANSIGEIPKICREIAQNKGREVYEEVLVEQRLDILKELYLAVTVDRTNKNYALIYSEKGGADIEELARLEPTAILKINFFEPDKKVGEVLQNKKIEEIALKLWRIIKEKDALLAEINPLVLTIKGEYVAADSKIVLDDNATALKTKKDSLSYVELEGDIGVIGNGAGLVMATLDSIKQLGGKPACFLDLGGGAGADAMQRAMAVVLSKKPRALFINIFAGITRCDEIAKGIIAYKNEKGISTPMTVRMSGTNEKEARELLIKEGIEAVDDMEEGIRRITLK